MKESSGLWNSGWYPKSGMSKSGFAGVSKVLSVKIGMSGWGLWGSAAEIKCRFEIWCPSPELYNLYWISKTYIRVFFWGCSENMWFWNSNPVSKSGMSKSGVCRGVQNRDVGFGLWNLRLTLGIQNLYSGFSVENFGVGVVSKYGVVEFEIGVQIRDVQSLILK